MAKGMLDVEGVLLVVDLMAYYTRVADASPPPRMVIEAVEELAKISRSHLRWAERCCNEVISDEQDARKSKALRRKVDALLKGLRLDPADVQLIWKHDPRAGYGLGVKIVNPPHCAASVERAL